MLINVKLQSSTQPLWTNTWNCKSWEQTLLKPKPPLWKRPLESLSTYLHWLPESRNCVKIVNFDLSQALSDQSLENISTNPLTSCKIRYIKSRISRHSSEFWSYCHSETHQKNFVGMEKLNQFHIPVSTTKFDSQTSHHILQTLKFLKTASPLHNHITSGTHAVYLWFWKPNAE